MNGEESETKRIVQEIHNQKISTDRKASVEERKHSEEAAIHPKDEPNQETNSVHSEQSDVTQYSESEAEDEDDIDELQVEKASPQPQIVPASDPDPDPETEKPKRGRPKGSTKKKS